MTTAVRPGPLIRESFNRPYGHFRFWRLRHAEATMSLYRGGAEESVCVQTDANDESGHWVAAFGGDQPPFSLAASSQRARF